MDNLASVKELKEIQFAVTPPEEQVQILALFNGYESRVARISEGLQSVRLQVDRLRQSILKHAFEGRLVSQDPNDEPASLLLERIRVAREVERPRKKSRRSMTSTQRIQNS